MEKVALILDTNIFLQYDSIDKIDWNKFVNDSAIDLILVNVVLSELDEKKNSGNPRQKRRANNSISKIKEIRSNNGRVTDGIDLKSPKINTLNLEINELNIKLNDDLIINAALELSRSGEYSKTLVATSDLSLQVRLENYGLSHFDLEDNHKLPDEIDPIEKENSELKNQISQLNRIPKLKLNFGNNEEHLRFDLSPTRILTENDVDEVESRLRIKYPTVYTSELKLGTNPFASARSETILNRFADYNSRLEEWYPRQARYLIQKSQFDEQQSRTISFSIELENYGTMSATDLRILIQFPNSEKLQILNIFDEDDYPEPPEAPEAPKMPVKPNSSLDIFRLGQLFGPELSIFKDYDLPTVVTREKPNVTRKCITSSDTFNIEAHVKKAYHSGRVFIGTYCLVFREYEAAKSFKFNYTIFCEETSKPYSGNLNVEINKPE